MKYLLILISIMISLNHSYSNWEYKFSTANVTSYLSTDSLVFIGHKNGLTVNNLLSGKMSFFNSLNSALPGNQIKSFFKLKDNSVLISTNYGLALFKDGSINVENPLCSEFKGAAEKFYYDSTGKIWTFSMQTVYNFDAGVWTAVNFPDSIFFFDIQSLLILDKQVWAVFNDKIINNYYDHIKIAVIENNSIIKLFLTVDDFPYLEGYVKIAKIKNDVILKNQAGVYLYQNNTWAKTDTLNADLLYKPNYYSEFFTDNKGNIWYYIDRYQRRYPACFDIESGKVTAYLEGENFYPTNILTQLENGQIAICSNYNIYIKIDTLWENIPFTNIGLSYMAKILGISIINGKKYVLLTEAINDIPAGTLYSIEGQPHILPYNTNFPYSNIMRLAVGTDGKGIFTGSDSKNEPFGYESDSGFVNPKLRGTPKILTAADGKVYFSRWQPNLTINTPYISTWEGNELINIDMGYADAYDVMIHDFCVFENYIIAYGFYSYSSTSSYFISVYNILTKELTKYDNTNSCLTDYDYEEDNAITAESKDVFWIKTPVNFIRFTKDSCNYFELPYGGNGISGIDYDIKSHELLFIRWNFEKMLYNFDIKNGKLDSLDLWTNKLKGDYLNHRQLLNKRIYACDDLGYLFQYEGNKTFKEINLNINGKSNFGFPVYDMCLDANNTLYLGTDIGLIYSKDLILDVENISSGNLQLNVMPNPSSDYIKIDLPSELNFNRNIEIYSLLGIKMLTINTNEILQDINISNLPNGIYYIKSGDFIGKFIKTD